MIPIRCLVLAACLVGLAGLPSGAAAGAWTQKTGGGFHRLDVNFVVVNDEFTTDGTKIQATKLESDSSGAVFRVPTEFTERNLTYSGELGLNNRLTLFGSIAVKDLLDETRLPSGGIRSLRNIGVGDLDMGLRYRVLAEPVVVSLSIAGKFPWFYDEKIPFDEGPVLGSGQYDAEIRWLIQKGFSQYGYVGVELGYRYRTEDPADEYRYLLEYGLDVTERFYARTRLDGIKSAKNSDPMPPGRAINPLVSNEFDLGRWQLSAGYRYQADWSGEVTYIVFPYGKNIGAASIIQLALIRRF